MDIAEAVLLVEPVEPVVIPTMVKAEVTAIAGKVVMQEPAIMLRVAEAVALLVAAVALAIIQLIHSVLPAVAVDRVGPMVDRINPQEAGEVMDRRISAEAQTVMLH
jgi:hypothetical protein